jgi:hypothetical protein
MTRIIVITIAALGVFFFPWPYAMFLAFIAALFIPVLGLVFGLLSDLLYFSHSASHVPWATIIGAFSSAVAFFVRRFIKTRIMGA